MNSKISALVQGYQEMNFQAFFDMLQRGAEAIGQLDPDDEALDDWLPHSVLQARHCVLILVISHEEFLLALGLHVVVLLRKLLHGLPLPQKVPLHILNTGSMHRHHRAPFNAQELTRSVAAGIVNTMKDICPMDAALFDCP